MGSLAPKDNPTFDDALRDELLPLVLQHLPLEDLCRAQRVCRRLRDAVATAQNVWQRLYAATWPHQDAADGKETQQQQSQQQQSQQQQQQQGQSSGSTDQQPNLPPWPSPQLQHQQVQHLRPPAASSSILSPAVAVPVRPPSGSGSSTRKRGREAVPDPGAAADAAGTSASGAGSGAEANWREIFKARFVEQARRERLKRQARRLKAESALQVLRQEVHRLEASLAQEQRILPALERELAALQRARQQAATAALSETYWQPVAVQRAHGVVTDQAPLDAESREHDLQQRLAVSQLEARKLQAALAAKRRRAAEALRRLQALLP